MSQNRRERRTAEESRSYWNNRHAETPIGEPSPFLLGVERYLPREGKALDIAGGSGRNALWLAGCGLEVTVADISPAGLEMAAHEASRLGLALTTLEADIEREGIPQGPWPVMICFHFLHRPLFSQMSSHLSPEGVLVCEIATVRNLERNERPPRHFLLEEGELAGLTASLQLLVYEEGWTEDGRHTARLVARLGKD